MDGPDDGGYTPAGSRNSAALRRAISPRSFAARRLSAGGARALQADEGDRSTGLHGTTAWPGGVGREGSRTPVVRADGDCRVDGQEDAGALQGHAAEDPVHRHA